MIERQPEQNLARHHQTTLRAREKRQVTPGDSVSMSSLVLSVPLVNITVATGQVSYAPDESCSPQDFGQWTDVQLKKEMW